MFYVFAEFSVDISKVVFYSATIVSVINKIIAWFIKEKFVLGGEIALLF